MYYIYYNDDGNITAVANMIDSSFGEFYLEVDLKTYTMFANGSQQMLNYRVIENIKVKGQMQLLPLDIDEFGAVVGYAELHRKGIIPKQKIEKSCIIITQHLTGSWSVTSTMDDEICSLFAMGDDHIKEYYVVDPNNRFILLDTLRVNLKTLALYDTSVLEDYNTELCKQNVSLYCNSHYVKHIHTIEE